MPEAAGLEPDELSPSDQDDELRRAILDNMRDGVYYVDRGRRIMFWNKGAETLSGYDSEAVVGHYCYQNLLNHVDAAGKQLCHDGCPLSATMADGKPREAAIFLRHREGHRVPVRVRTMPVYNGAGRVIGGIETFDNDITLSAAQQEAAELRDLAMTDTLTELPNRRQFEATMTSRISDLTSGGRRFGLLIADIDHFGLFNTRHGHLGGDVALRTVARTLLESSRPGDDVSRFGGEEFALTIAEVNAPELRVIAERFRALVEKSRVQTGKRNVRVTISIGGALARAGDTRETIFERADAALYRAKNAGRNRVRLHGDPEFVSA